MLKIQKMPMTNAIPMPTSHPVPTPIHIIVASKDSEQIAQQLGQTIQINHLPLQCSWVTLEQLNNKTVKLAADTIAAPVLLAEYSKSGLTCTLCNINKDAKGKISLSKINLDWHKLQRRIVTAGRKTELLLQACKLTAGMQVLDATAGFGHDSLILASSGSRVTLVEQQPVMALLLMLEQQKMNQEKNWQGLMKRLDIICQNALDYLQSLQTCKALNDTSLASLPLPINQPQLPKPQKPAYKKFDLIYLDPMFPHQSYAGAKVGKGMQLLHELAKPPTVEEENHLLQMAKLAVLEGGRVVVKRPKNAAFLANHTADESWANDVVRFDAYF